MAEFMLAELLPQIQTVLLLEADGCCRDGDPEELPDLLRAQALQEERGGRHMHSDLLSELPSAAGTEPETELGGEGGNSNQRSQANLQPAAAEPGSQKNPTVHAENSLKTGERPGCYTCRKREAPDPRHTVPAKLPGHHSNHYPPHPYMFQGPWNHSANKI